MSDETTMKKCNHIECGGKLQPHSLDSATGELDCDGPCSPRRVQMWRDALNKQPTEEPQPDEPVPEDTRTDEEVRADMCYWKQ
jgi:hypothetical protein